LLVEKLRAKKAKQAYKEFMSKPVPELSSFKPPFHAEEVVRHLFVFVRPSVPPYPLLLPCSPFPTISPFSSLLCFQNSYAIALMDSKKKMVGGLESFTSTNLAALKQLRRIIQASLALPFRPSHALRNNVS